MDRKILIVLEVPAIRNEFEMRVPDNLQLKKMIPLMVKAVNELSGGTYVSSGHELLCTRRLNGVLDAEGTLANYSMVNGERLLLL